jgi:hypothetical protein
LDDEDATTKVFGVLPISMKNSWTDCPTST